MTSAAARRPEAHRSTRLRRFLARHAPRACLWIWPDPGPAELGRVGEELVARALRRRGDTLEGRRLRTPWGELDVLSRDARGLVCVEVKSARRAPMPRIRGEAAVPLSARDRPGERVDARGLDRLQRIAAGLAARRRLVTRCEVWEVLVGPRRGAIEIRLRDGT